MGGAGLLDQKAQPARKSTEPAKPSDPKWKCRNGVLRDDYGPTFPIIRTSYSNGEAAVLRQEDGSGFAHYSSGRKAVQIQTHNKSHRVSANVFADTPFVVPSAVPVHQRPIPVVHSRSLPVQEDDRPDPTRKNRTAHMGALDEWGCGKVQSVPDAATEKFGLYHVTSTHVIVTAVNGTKTSVPRHEQALLVQNLAQLKLRLNEAMVISYDVNHGTTLIEFSCSGVKHDFHIGETWKVAPQVAHPMSHPATTPAEQFAEISLKQQINLDSSIGALNDAHGKLRTTYLGSVGNQTLQSPLSKSASAPTLKPGLASPAPAPGMDATIKPSLSSTGTSPHDISKPLMDLSKSLMEGRVEFHFEHHMKQKLRSDARLLPLKKAIPIGTLKEGYAFPRPHVGKPAIDDRTKTKTPISLKEVTVKQIAEIASELEEKPVLLAVLVVADWASKSANNSCAHGRVICEGAVAELADKGYGDRVKFCVAQMSEAGGVHSSTKWENPLSKYGVKSVPWMLMFSGGRMIMSENPSNGDFGGGLGFTSKLRYEAFCKPRILLLQPPPSHGAHAFGISGPNSFKIQLQTQDVLKRAGYSFDLALSQVDARQLANSATPPYGMLLCSSDAGASAFSEVSARLKQRCPNLLCYIYHNGVGEMDEAMKALSGSCTGVFMRPISKSSLAKALFAEDAARVKYQQCGMTRPAMVDLIERKLVSA